VGDGTPISERGPSGGRPKGVPSWGPGHQGWQGGIGHFAPSVWQTGDWWHGKRAAGVAGGGMSPGNVREVQQKPLRRWSWYAGDVAITGSFGEDAHHDREER
jgi:hypothetical protein